MIPDTVGELFAILGALIVFALILGWIVGKP